MWGSHMIKHYSTTQSTIALSSGEAELTGLVKGATHSLGFQALAEDMDLRLKIDIFSDASAAIGICRRRGLGKIRHLHVGDLWIQERLQAGDFNIHKIQEQENPADILTNYVEKPLLLKMLPKMSLFHEQGRADLAPNLTQCIVPINFPRTAR